MELYSYSVSHLYKLKTIAKQASKVKYYEDVIIEATHKLLEFKISEGPSSSYRDWVNQYRRVWRNNLDLFYFTLCLFIISIVVGWNIGVSKPSYVALIIPQNLMEMIVDHTSWFAELQENPLLGGLIIAINNIKVSIVCFLLGTLCGIGGIGILCFNGILFGTMFGFCLTKGFHNHLLNFVLAHGFLELTIIIASCFAGLLIGRVFYIRPYENFQKRIGLAAKEAGIVASGEIPWLILAAIIEGFVSPFHYLNMELKGLLGITVCLTFVIWTFRPETPGELDSKR
jgi:uncharacterized membrane protein SpoIIM required for sporulation